jgi:hypothetical protein
MEQIIKELNDLKILQKEFDFLEDLPDDIYEKYFHELVDEGLEVDKRRWYETSISVFKINEGSIGVRHISNLYSEQSSVLDIFYTIKFFEMKQIITTTFEVKF